MKPELIEQYVMSGRRALRSDEQIRQDLIIGGYDPVMIDNALKNAAENVEKAAKKIEEVIKVEEPIFFGAFLKIFILLLALYNIVSYWGQIFGDPNATPVSNTDLIGGIVFSLIGAFVLALIYTGIRKMFKKMKAKKA